MPTTSYSVVQPAQSTVQQIVKEVVPVEVLSPPVVQQNVTLYQPRPDPSLTVVPYPQEWYYCEAPQVVAKAKAQAQVISQATKTLSLKVGHGDDDCEQKLSTGKTSLHDDDLDLREGRLVGIRFQKVSIKPKQQIRAARLHFTTKLDKSDNCQVDIFGDASGDAKPFTHELNALGGRSRTFAQVHWSIPPWTPGTTHSSEDLAPIIQEIVNLPHWAEGNSLVLILHGTSGHRSAWAFDGNPSNAPQLVIEVVEAAVHQVSDSSAPQSPVHQPSEVSGGSFRRQPSATLHSPGPFPGAPPQRGPVHLAGPSPDVHDGYDAFGFVRNVGPQGDPWHLPDYAHPNQKHQPPPHHNQTAHLIYEDKFRYARYNLSHECLRPTRLERQVPESARPLLEASRERVPPPAPAPATITPPASLHRSPLPAIPAETIQPLPPLSPLRPPESPASAPALAWSPPPPTPVQAPVQAVPQAIPMVQPTEYGAVYVFPPAPPGLGIPQPRMPVYGAGALALDAADGVFDGKYFGASIAV
eukprot:GGOE01018386.1.p1 GENE.GGOE01018386.1~~GGOE01018386.1.p1  ORF type:complete len:554 (-),score=54.88 GGOE01018386.1:247-1824(-)